MTEPDHFARTGLYRGWSVLAGGFACSALAMGSTVYVFGMLVLPISQEFGLSRSATNVGMIALLVSMAAWGALFGRIIDQASARIVMPFGGLALIAGALALAWTPSPKLMLLATLVLLGLGTTAGGSLAAHAVVSRWFRRRRGRAMGIMALATSGGGFIMPPLMAYLIANYGWRTGVVVVGLIAGTLIIVSSALLMRDRPTQEALAAAGELDEAGSSSVQQLTAAEPEWSIRDMLRSREFWLIQLAVALLMGSDQAILSLKVPYYQSQGVTLQAASLLLAVQTGAAIIGKLAIGFLSERIDVRRIFSVICALHIVALLLFINWPGYWVMLGLLSVLGVAIGGVLPCKLVLIASAFGSRSFGQVVGAMTIMVQLLSIIFIYVSGRLFDAYGNYDMAFWLFMIGVMISLFLIQMVRLPTKDAPAVTDGLAIEPQG